MRGRLQELKNKGKVQLRNPKSVHGRLWEWLLTTAFHYKFLVTGNTNLIEDMIVAVVIENNFETSMVFKFMASALALQCSTN